MQLRRGVCEVDAHFSFLRRHNLSWGGSSLRPQHVCINHHYLLVDALSKVLLIKLLLPLIKHVSAVVKNALEAPQLLDAVNLACAPREPQRHRENVELGDAHGVDHRNHGVQQEYEVHQVV